MGLLPEVAADLHVSIPRAGLLISGYAMGVAIGGPLLAAATVRLPRKGTLAGLMAAGPNPQLQRRRFRKTPHGKKLSRLLVGARLVDWRLMPSLVAFFWFSRRSWHVLHWF